MSTHESDTRYEMRSHILVGEKQGRLKIKETHEQVHLTSHTLAHAHAHTHTQL